MMRLPRFTYRAPATVAEACAILAGEGEAASVMAGGTDLLPNMKRRQQTPATVVSLRRVAALHAMRHDGGLDVGAAVTLERLVDDGGVASRFTGLHRAVAQIATPHLRATATLGGNVLLDTRCNYYDQTWEWRRAIDFCMKKDGKTCWVAPSSPRCLALSSTDGAPALMALGAHVTLASTRGERRVPLPDLYRNDGQFYLEKAPDELLTAIHVPAPDGWRSTYWKLRQRGSIDFPVLGVAAALRLDGGVVSDLRLVLGALASRPLAVPVDALRGRPLDDEAVAEAVGAASALAKPTDNADFTVAWRKVMVKTFVAGVLRQLRGDDPAALGLLARRAAQAGAPATAF